MNYPTRISHREFYLGGAFSNPNYFRKMQSDTWTYRRLK